MKKWLIVFAALVFVGFFIRYLVVYEDVYVDLNPDAPITVDAKADSSQIYVRNGLEYEPFVVKGVLVEGFLPGYYDNDFPADEKTYLNWMTLLADMGANTICTHTIMNSAFYNALYRFNTEAETPLYLLQGVSPSDYDQNNGQDAGAFIQKLISDGKRAVDVIHGREYLALGRMGGSGSYTKDVSPWVLGYLLGNEWVGYTVAYTDALHEEESPYVGEFSRRQKTLPHLKACWPGPWMRLHIMSPTGTRHSGSSPSLIPWRLIPSLTHRPFRCSWINSLLLTLAIFGPAKRWSLACLRHIACTMA